MSFNIGGIISSIGGALGVDPNVVNAGVGIADAFGYGAQPTSVGALATPSGFVPPPIFPQPEAAAAAAVATDPFRGGHVAVPKSRWDAFAALPVQSVDVINADQADDANVAKLAMTHGVIPANSDLGIALQRGGAKVTTRKVKMSDGTVIEMAVIGSRGKRRRSYTATPRRMRAAARTLRAMGQTVRTYKGLAKLGAKIDRQLSPRRATGPCKAVRTTTCRKR